MFVYTTGYRGGGVVEEYQGQDTTLCMTTRVPGESCTVRYPGILSTIHIIYSTLDNYRILHNVSINFHFLHNYLQATRGQA